MMNWQHLLEAEASQVYKQDRRSRVWRVAADAQGDVVIKRFEYSPLRQRVAMMIGIHPAQAEIRNARSLAEADVPVVSILGMHVQSTGCMGAGAKVHLATRWQGQSLQQMMRQQHQDVAGSGSREKILTQLGQLAATMLLAGWVFRDLKTSNILIDKTGTLRLIDAGSARRIGKITPGSAPARAWRMLWMLDHTLEHDGWSKDQRIACLARPLAIISNLPVKLAHEKLEAIKAS